MEAQKFQAYLKAPYYQGLGRYVPQLARMTLKFCKSSGSSRELRRFIETGLVDFARANPGTAIYLKPRLFKSPVVVTEYLNGQSHYLNLHGMSKDQVHAWINWYTTRSGEELYKLILPVTTYKPSVQGQWNPFYNRDPHTTITEFPNEDLGKHKSNRLSATEQLLNLANKQE